MILKAIQSILRHRALWPKSITQPHYIIDAIGPNGTLILKDTQSGRSLPMHVDDLLRHQTRFKQLSCGDQRYLCALAHLANIPSPSSADDQAD